jgi:hypothetical protein
MEFRFAARYGFVGGLRRHIDPLLLGDRQHTCIPLGNIAPQGSSWVGTLTVNVVAKDYTWNISRRTVRGVRMYVWAVLERTDRKIVISGRELSRAAAVLAAMRAIHQRQHPKMP